MGRSTDRMCPARALNNPLRRRFAPGSRETAFLDLAPGQVVADLGTGVGFLLPSILDRIGSNGRLYAADVDRENLDIARDNVKADPRVQFLERSAAKVPEIPDEGVDRACLSLVLCCMLDKQGALDEVWRVLRPGGLVMCTYPPAVPRFGPSLAVSKKVWKELVGHHPWEVVPVKQGVLVHRHLLRKPARETGTTEPRSPRKDPVVTAGLEKEQGSYPKATP